MITQDSNSLSNVATSNSAGQSSEMLNQAINVVRSNLSILFPVLDWWGGSGGGTSNSGGQSSEMLNQAINTLWYVL